MLPKEEKYAPPLNIKILDKRAFGQLPMVGTNVIKTLEDFVVDPTPGIVRRTRDESPGNKDRKWKSPEYDILNS